MLLLFTKYHREPRQVVFLKIEALKQKIEEHKIAEALLLRVEANR